MPKRVKKSVRTRARGPYRTRRYYICDVCGARMRQDKHRGQVVMIYCPRCGNTY